MDEGEAEEFARAQKKRGVVYMARIPPHMKPPQVRDLLSVHGEIDRIYLAPEDESGFRRRKKAGGNKKRNFTEGWIEFLDKRVAIRTCKMLNNQPMGGPKKAFYRNDLWNLKYLQGFKWNHLQEKVLLENAERKQKIAAETRQAQRETNFYTARVEQAKRIEAKNSRLAKKAAKTAEDATAATATATATPAQSTAPPATTHSGLHSEDLNPILRKFQQRHSLAGSKREHAVSAEVAAKIFPAGKEEGTAPQKKKRKT